MTHVWKCLLCRVLTVDSLFASSLGKRKKPHHIQPHSRWRWTHVHCFSFSRDSFTSRLVSPLPPPKSCPLAEPSHWGKTRLSCSCRCFFFFLLFPASTAHRSEHKQRWLDREGWRRHGRWSCIVNMNCCCLFLDLLVLCLCLLLTPMFTWTTDYQGLEENYLNMMPLKHAIAFIYDDFLCFTCFVSYYVLI